MKKRNKNSRQKRRTDLTKRLAGYSVAAGAVLAVGGQANAEIFYDNDVNENFGGSSGRSFELTMEELSTPEVSFLASFGDYYRDILVKGIGNNFGVNTDSSFVVKRSIGDSIAGSSSSNPYQIATGLFSRRVFTTDPTSAWVADPGNWHDGDKGYFGFSFQLENNTDVYGWGSVEIIEAGHGRLLEWAYQSDGSAIEVGATGTAVVPLPSSLALFALGMATAGVKLRKEKKKS